LIHFAGDELFVGTLAKLLSNQMYECKEELIVRKTPQMKNDWE
jgi:hypothetical protein